MRKQFRYSLLVGLSLVVLSWYAVAGTLETKFTVVVAKDLPIGHRAPLLGSDGRQYAIRNNSDQTVEVRFTALKPFQQIGQKRAYADIPDPSWLTIEPLSLTLGPREEGRIELHLAVPDDKRYANRKYEVWLLAQAQGGNLGVGLITRIKFNTLEHPITSPAENRPQTNTVARDESPANVEQPNPKDK
jgi:hypothetical protein